MKMRKLFVICSSTLFLALAGFANAGGQQDMPNPPVQSAEPHKTTPPSGGDYLEQQPDQNNATSRNSGDSKQQQNNKVKQPGKSHQKQPDGGGVEVK
jgi:hypothetical protein